MAAPSLERREAQRRGWRLVVIFAAIAAIMISALVWNTVANHRLDSRADRATEAVRVAFREFDISAADRAAKAASSDPRPSPFPEVDDADFLGGSITADRVRATFQVSAMGKERCFFVAARGAAPPNRVRIVERGC